MVFHGANTSAELVAFGEAHTHGDCCLILSKEKIAFLGDLAFFQGQPYMNDCNPLSWKTILDEISRVGVKVFIPGHGQPGTKSEILLLSEYLTSMVNLVSQIIHEGGSVEDALKCSLPAPFHLWQNSGRHLFEDNVRFLYQCMRNRDEF
jgi:cyclase